MFTGILMYAFLYHSTTAATTTTTTTTATIALDNGYLLLTIMSQFPSASLLT